MEIPSNISSIILRINQSEDNWKAIFMAIWQYAGIIKVQYENTPNWDSKIEFGLPASKNNSRHSYTFHKLHSILTSRDEDFTLRHLQTLFSLFEELLNEASEILFPQKLKTYKWDKMEEFFKNDKTKDILSSEEIKELKLAKMTRNCYIHNGSKIDQPWVDSYKEAKGNSTNLMGQELHSGFPTLFHKIEDWNELIVNTASKIKTKIESQ